MFKNIKGIVLKKTPFGDSDEYLSVLTEADGILTVCANHIRSPRNASAAACAMFCYSDFTLSQKGERYTLKSAEPIRHCLKIGADCTQLALACYFTELVCDLGVAQEDCRRILTLYVNALCIAAKADRDPNLIKAVFELRLMAESGFCPELETCAGCRRAGLSQGVYDPAAQEFFCPDCAPGIQKGAAVTPGASALARRLLCLPDSRAFALRIAGAEEQKSFFAFCETYLLSHMGKEYQTLAVYKSLEENHDCI